MGRQNSKQLVRSLFLFSFFIRVGLLLLGMRSTHAGTLALERRSTRVIKQRNKRGMQRPCVKPHLATANARVLFVFEDVVVLCPLPSPAPPSHVFSLSVLALCSYSLLVCASGEFRVRRHCFLETFRLCLRACFQSFPSQALAALSSGSP